MQMLGSTVAEVAAFVFAKVFAEVFLLELIIIFWILKDFFKGENTFFYMIEKYFNFLGEPSGGGGGGRKEHPIFF
jgi:hypothetical protein